MTKFCAVLSSLGISLVSFGSVSIASGQCDLADVPEPHRAVMTLEDAPGIWFVSPLARCLLRDVELAAVREREVRILTEQLELFRDRSDSVDAALEASERRASSLAQALELMTERAVAAEAWYLSPYIWTAIGIVLGVSGSVIVSLAI